MSKNKQKSTNENTMKRLRTTDHGRSVRSIALAGLLLAMASLLAVACTPATTETPQPTSSPIPARGSLRGRLWHDLCVNGEAGGPQPTGCTISLDQDRFIANGILEPGENGIGEVKVSLGAGACPSSGLSENLTSPEGVFSFSGLSPGIYCVSVDPSNLAPGAWSTPAAEKGLRTGMLTVALGLDENLEGINFGWDFDSLPDAIPPTARPTAIASPAPACTDAADFIQDVSIPDGTRFDGGEYFTKTWRLHNRGTCTWNSEYALVLISGYSLGSSGLLSLPTAVAPGGSIDLSIPLQAPSSNGSYKGVWMLRNPVGELFGVGDDASRPFWVVIKVGPEPEPEITEWRGEYFDNAQLAGEPILVRNDEKIDFNWKFNNPADNVPEDDFSVRWTRTLEFRNDIYRFHLEMDDGASLWVDDRLVIDEWRLGAKREVTIDLAMVKGKHDLRVEYYEDDGRSSVSFWWERIKSPSYPGWEARYWFNTKLNSSFAVVKSVSEIDFDWGKGSPILGIPKNSFSAQWKRTLEFEPGVYRFSASADDGIRVLVDNVMVMDEWHDSDASQQYRSDVTLNGAHTIEVEYYERNGNAEVEFQWQLLSSPNEPPVAQDDVYDVEVNTQLVVLPPGFLVNDSDPDGDALSPELVNSPSHGTLSLGWGGGFTYTPDTDFSGNDSFQYQVSDGTLQSNTATVTLSVVPANTPPQAVEDAYSTPFEQELVVPAPGVLINDLDADGDALTASLDNPASHGEVSLQQDGSFTYLPQVGFSGADTFSYTASDGQAASIPVTVTITVAPPNGAPITTDDAYTTDEDTALNVAAPGLLANDDDPDGDALAAELAELPNAGQVVVNSDGSFSYTPQPDFHGSDSFTYSVDDGHGNSSTAQVIITVNPINDTPQAQDDFASSEGDTPVDIPVLANDLGLGDRPLTISLETSPGEGIVELIDNLIRYTPFGGFTGSDSFTYSVTDLDGEISSATVIVTLSWSNP